MNDQLTFEELRAYQSGRLSGADQHRVERLLLEDPFYADALAGLEAMQQTATPTAQQLASLRNALESRIRASATRKRLWPLWIATTTAAIVFMLAMAIYFIFFAPNRPAPQKPPGIPAKTVQIGHEFRLHICCNPVLLSSVYSSQKSTGNGSGM